MSNKNQKIKKNMKPDIIKYVNEDTNEIKKFIYILVGVALVAVLLYWISAKYLIKDNFQDKDTSINEEINYDAINVGNLFNRPYEEYYVLAYDTTTSDAVYPSALKENYKGDKKIYTIDLSLDVNKNYISDSGNSNATKISELALVNPTLIKIHNGAINEYYEGIDKIESVLR